MMDKLSANLILIKTFFIRDMKIFASYKLLLFTTIFGIIMNAILFFYFSKLVDSSPNPYLNGSYYMYVIYGVAATDLSVVVINRLNNEIRDYQLTGVIDSLLSSHHSDLKILILSYPFGIFMALIRFFIYIFLASFISGQNIFDINNLPYLILIITLYIAVIIGIGLMAASITVLFKRGNPILYIYFFLSSSIGGVFFPPTVFPSYVQFVSELMPIKILLDILRDFQTGFQFINVGEKLLILLCYALIFLISGFFLMKLSLRMARMKGQLTNY